MDSGGTYTLVFALPELATIEVGAFGEQWFPDSDTTLAAAATAVNRHRQAGGS